MRLARLSEGVSDFRDELQEMLLRGAETMSTDNLKTRIARLEKRRRPSNEQRYYDALKRIAAYQSPDSLRRHSEGDYGLGFEEALEYAYENVLNEARLATKNRRRPKA